MYNFVAPLTFVILSAENLTSAMDVYVWRVIFSHTVKYLLNENVQVESTMGNLVALKI